MLTFFAVIVLIVLSTLIGSTISWAIARLLLGALEQAYPPRVPVDSATRLTTRVS